MDKLISCLKEVGIPFTIVKRVGEIIRLKYNDRIKYDTYIEIEGLKFYFFEGKYLK
jgi:hypothetical protein